MANRYRQNRALPWDARQTPVVQPSGKLLQAHEFSRGGAASPLGTPNGQVWIPALPGWSVWSRSNTLAFNWIDANRQAGVVQLLSPEDELGQAFAAAYYPAPPIPAGASSYEYSIYARAFQLDGRGVEDIVDTFFGLMLSFAPLPADGPFIAGGVAVRADIPPPPAPLTAARTVFVSPTGLDTNDGTALSPWLTIARVGVDLANYTELRAGYTVELVGTGTVVNSDLWIPPITLAGFFDVICRTFTTLAGPFSLTAATAPLAITLTVGAGGLGVNTYRGKTVRFLTGAQAGFGYRSVLLGSTDTVATVSALQTSPGAIGDTFDIVEAAVKLSGSATWELASALPIGLLAIPLTGYATITNTAVVGGTLALAGGTWWTFGLELDSNTTVRLNLKNTVLFSGGTAGVPFTRLGQLNFVGWNGWVVTQPVAAAAQSALSMQSSIFRGGLSAPQLIVGERVTAGGFTQGSTSRSGWVAFAITAVFNIFGSAANIPLVIYGGDISLVVGAASFIGGNPAGPLVDMYGGNLIMSDGGTFVPGAAVLNYLRTQRNATIQVRTPIAPALTAVGSIACDSRAGGSIRWGSAPNLVGAAGDLIVDNAVGPVLNAALATAQSGISNPQTGGLICRQF